jgi:hypothetical protein
LESSALNLNRNLPQTWDEDAIVERSRQFAESLCRLLPRPRATADAAEQPEQAPPDAALTDDIGGTVEDADAAVDAEVDVDVQPEIRIRTISKARRGDIANHIQEVLGSRPPGAVMTVSQLSRAISSEYPSGGAGGSAIRNRLKSGTVSGVATTTDQSGYLAATLADRPGQPRSSEALVAVRPSSSGDVSALEARFHQEMVRVYGRARDEAGYHAKQFLRMLTERGGLRTARLLVRATTISDGFRSLWERGRLDLTVEAIMLQPEFVALFTDEERAIARDRLAQFGWHGVHL